MQCRLCSQKGEICNSHIIPEFVYKTLYDEKHSFTVLSTSPNPPRQSEQKGLREKLFCRDCEAKLSRYEDYARRVVVGGTKLIERKTNLGHLIEGIDYKLFKLFLLSILFRAGISRHDMFKRVHLGPHEERIRAMLVQEDPGAQTDYPCLMIGLAGDKKLTQNVIDQPTKIRKDGITIYRFMYLGFLWVYFVSSHLKKDFLADVLLAENGSMTVPIKNFSDLKHIEAFFAEAAEKGLV